MHSLKTKRIKTSKFYFGAYSKKHDIVSALTLSRCMDDDDHDLVPINTMLIWVPRVSVLVYKHIPTLELTDWRTWISFPQWITTCRHKIFQYTQITKNKKINQWDVYQLVEKSNAPIRAVKRGKHLPQKSHQTTYGKSQTVFLHPRRLWWLFWSNK